MKHLISLCFFLSIALVSYGQEIIDQLTESACQCAQEKDLSNLDNQRLQMELGLCIIQGLSDLDPKTLDSLKLDMTDQVAMTKLGESIGLRMASKCPAVLMKVVTNAESAQQLEKTKDAEIAVSKELRGRITAVALDEITTVSLETGDGSILKLVWLRPFIGSEDYLSDPKKLIDKQVKIAYENFELYHASMKQHIKRKEIVSLEVME